MEEIKRIQTQNFLVNLRRDLLIKFNALTPQRDKAKEEGREYAQDLIQASYLIRQAMGKLELAIKKLEA